MKLIKYLFGKFMLPAYIIVSAVLSLVFTLAAGGGLPVFLRMLPVVPCLLLTLRASDDIFDYEKDGTRKTQYLGKGELIALACAASAVFVTLNVLFYGWIGFASLAAVGYIPLQEKLPPLKTAYMALLFLFYFCVNRTAFGAVQLAVTAGCLAASAAYYIIKRKVRK